jgi:hypothetical protein
LATKYLKAVISRPWSPLALPETGKLDRGIHKELDAPIKPEHDSFTFKGAGVISGGTNV